MKKLNNFAVIYCIINIQNNKKYIGSSVDIKKRLRDHFWLLKNNNHHNPKLQAAYNNYGKECFICEILCHEQLDRRLARETELIQKLNPEYNIATDATAPMMGRKHSPETIQKFKDDPKRGGKGKSRVPWSEETRALHKKVRVGLKRNPEFGKRRKLEALADNRQRYLDKSRELAKRKVNDSLGNVFPSMVDCAKFHGISVQTVCDILKGRHNKTRKGVFFTYV